MTGRDITVHRVGTPEAPHVVSVESFRDYLTDVLRAHEPSNTVPVARLEFPAGFWVTLTTAPGKEAPRP